VQAAKDIHADRTVYGESYVWGTPYLTDEEAVAEAQLRHEAALAAQVTFRGVCDLLDLTPGSVMKLSNRPLPDAKHGLLVVQVTCSASRKTPYRVAFDAIPSDRFYRLPLLEETWPRIEGVITGTIASTGRLRDPHLDARGRYIVHIHADQDARTPGLQSCPMRLAKPFAGADHTGFHFGLVDGTVVTVGFLWGNPDLPYISQVLHTAGHPDPIVASGPWGTRNTIRTRSNNTIELDDRKDREHIKVSTECGKSLDRTLGTGRDRRGNAEQSAGLGRKRRERCDVLPLQRERREARGHRRGSGGFIVRTPARYQAVRGARKGPDPGAKG
jgi:type VI secretion system secreted protein VgrG